MRYFFHIGYSGHNYIGWQRQRETITIQQVLEEQLSKILKKTIKCIGCGRTDGLVHASQYFFHIDVEQKWDYDIVFRLNKTLPDDIAIFETIPVASNKHTQFDAISRTYDYYIHTSKNPFLNLFSTLYLEKNLQLDKMKEACSLLLKYSDYYSFCRVPTKYTSTICKIKTAQLFTSENGDRIWFQIKSKRYLQNMVRIIVVRLLLVGTGKMSIDEFEYYFKIKAPSQVFKMAYPQGLYLSKVEYPYLSLPTRSQFTNNTSAIWHAI